LAGFRLERLIEAPLAAVWEFLGNFTREAHGEVNIRLIDPGAVDQHHVGAIRRVEMGGRAFREELVEVQPQQRLSYRLLEGAPVKDYVGTIRFESCDLGTRIVWSVSYLPRTPIPGWLINIFAKRNIRQVLDHIEQQVCRHGGHGLGHGLG
jgi:hypothetical protein